jgi:Cdc6-like AAA superfamily ATPase
MLSPLNTAFLKISRRAETYDRAQLVATFVDIGALFTLLSNIDHQVLYGRRGTGKTHALYYLADAVEARGDLSAQLDLRTIGSSGGIYSDPTIALSERATRLLVDTLSAVHEQILAAAIERAEEVDLAVVGPVLDQFADAISEVSVLDQLNSNPKRHRAGLIRTSKLRA